jgi:hypothetical protein
VLIIDAQVHCYAADSPARPWLGSIHGPPAVTGDDQIATMDSVGVNSALLVSTWSVYRYDPSYAIEVQAADPSRFRMVAPVDP